MRGGARRMMGGVGRTVEERQTRKGYEREIPTTSPRAISNYTKLF